MKLGVDFHHLMIRCAAPLLLQFAFTISTYARVADILMFPVFVLSAMIFSSQRVDGVRNSM